MARYLRSGSGVRPAGRGLTELRTFGRVAFEPDHLDLERDEKRPGFSHRPPPSRWRTFPWGAVLAWGVAVVAATVVVVVAYRTAQVDLTQDDLEDGAVLSEEALAELEVRIQLASPDDARAAALAFDGEPVEVEGQETEEDEDASADGAEDADEAGDNADAEQGDGEGSEGEGDDGDADVDAWVDEDAIVWRPPADLDEGEYELGLTVPRLLMGPADFRWRFEVDTTAPTVDVPGVVDPVGIGDAVTVQGTVEEGSEVRASAGEVVVEDDGHFTLELSRAPAGPVRLEVVDRAENSARAEVVVPVNYPQSRSVYITAASWDDAGRREQILALADQGRLDAVHVQLKGPDGTVGFDTSVSRANDAGAVTVYVNLDSMVEALHERDVRVVGRISAFTDPLLAGRHWGAGQRDQVLQAPSGEPYGSGPEYTNPADPGVRSYNLELAVDAVGRGVDEIVWDGVLLPGNEEIVVPDFDGAAVDAVAGFLTQAHTELRRHGAFQGVASPGLAIYQDQPREDLTRLARHVDYLVPRIEPLYWSSGSLDVADPSSSPGEFVGAYLERYNEVAEPSGTVVVPQVQAFSYSEDRIRAQASAARSRGPGYVLYAPEADYSGAMLAQD